MFAAIRRADALSCLTGKAWFSLQSSLIPGKPVVASLAYPLCKSFFPSGAPFDARRAPFPGTPCSSQANGLSELIPCIRLCRVVQTSSGDRLAVFFPTTLGVSKNTPARIGSPSLPRACRKINYWQSKRRSMMAMSNSLASAYRVTGPAATSANTIRTWASTSY
jgi:hypothetical protein